MTFVVIGVGQGIGRGILETLKEKKKTYISMARNVSILPQDHPIWSSQELINADLNKQEDIIKIANQLPHFHISGFIYCAGLQGITTPSNFNGLDIDIWKDAFFVNAVAPIILLRACLPPLANNNGKALILSSAMGLFWDKVNGSTIYASTKAALNSAIWSLRHELERSGVPVGICRPGQVKTQMNPNGTVSPKKAGSQILDLLDTITLEQTGKFLDIDGSVLPFADNEV